MATKEDIRRVSIYINGDAADLTLKQLTAGTNKLNRELGNLTIGTEEYKEKMEQLGESREVLNQVKDDINKVGQAMEESKGFFADWKKGFAELQEIAERVTIGTLIYKSINYVIEGVKELVNSAKESYEKHELAELSLQNKIRTTGEVAGESIGKLKEYQEAEMKQTGVDEDVIAKGQDILLTYTNIRGRIYDQALPAVLDYTAAMNNGKVTMEGVQSSAELLGRGLDDVTKAKKTLRAMGITLSTQEQQEITLHRKNNDLMGAQQIIIDAVTKRYGGLLDTLSKSESGELQRYNTKLEEISKSLGQWLTHGKALTAEFLTPFVDWLREVTTTKLSETLEQERMEMNKLGLEIVSTNTSHEERVKLINKLKAMYPDYLKFLDAEKSSNLEIANATRQLNDMYVNRIILAQKDQEIEKQNQETAELRIKQLKAEDDIRSAIVKLRESKLGLKVPETGNDADKLAAMLVQYKKLQEAARNTTGGVFDPTFEAGKALKEYEDYEEFAESAAKKANTMLEKRNALMKELGINEDFKGVNSPDNKPPAAPAGGLTPEELAAQEKEAERQRQKKQEYLDQSQALTEKLKEFNATELADTMQKNEKEVESVRNKYDKEINDASLALEKLKRSEFANANDIQNHQDEIAKLKTNKDAQVKAVRDRQDNELLERLDVFNAQLITKIENESQKEIDNINKKYDEEAKAAGANADKLYLIEIKREQALDQAKLNELERFKKEKERIDADAPANVKNDKQLQRDQINKEYDQKIADLKANHTAQLIETSAFNDAIAALNKQRDDKLGQIDKKDTDQYKQLAVSAAQSISNTLFEIGNRNREAEENAKITSLESQRSAELSNVNLTETQKSAINAKFNAEEAKIKKDAFEANKKAAIEQAIINGALGIMKLWVSPGFPAAIPLAVALGVETALQVATISSQPTPQFADGGYSAVDYTNPSGFVKRPTLFANSSSGRPFIAGEGNKTEYIVSSSQLQDPAVANFVGMMEANRGVRRFEMGGYSSTSPGAVVAPAGVISSSNDHGTRLDQVEGVVHNLVAIYQSQAAINEKPVIFSNRAYDKQNQKNVQIKNNATA